MHQVNLLLRAQLRVQQGRFLVYHLMRSTYVRYASGATTSWYARVFAQNCTTAKHFQRFKTITYAAIYGRVLMRAVIMHIKYYGEYYCCILNIGGPKDQNTRI